MISFLHLPAPRDMGLSVAYLVCLYFISQAYSFALYSSNRRAALKNILAKLMSLKRTSFNLPLPSLNRVLPGLISFKMASFNLLPLNRFLPKLAFLLLRGAPQTFLSVIHTLKNLPLSLSLAFKLPLPLPKLTPLKLHLLKLAYRIHVTTGTSGSLGPPWTFHLGLPSNNTLKCSLELPPLKLLSAQAGLYQLSLVCLYPGIPLSTTLLLTQTHLSQNLITRTCLSPISQSSRTITSLKLLSRKHFLSQTSPTHNFLSHFFTQIDISKSSLTSTCPSPASLSQTSLTRTGTKCRGYCYRHSLSPGKCTNISRI